MGILVTFYLCKREGEREPAPPPTRSKCVREREGERLTDRQTDRQEDMKTETE